MKLFYEERAVADIELDREGRPRELRYDPRWLATSGAFPVARSLPLGPGPFDRLRIAEWARHLTLDSRTPLEGALSRARSLPLFGALTLRPDGGDPPDHPLEAERALKELDAFYAAQILFARALGRLCGIAMTDAVTIDGEMRIVRADRRARAGRVERLPLECVSFGWAPLRSTTLFRRLDRILDAPDRLALFDRVAFAGLLGVDAPATAIRLDGAPRLAPVGADWTGAGPNLSDRALDLSSWRAFALKSGLNKTFAPRRVAALADEMARKACEAAERATDASLKDMTKVRDSLLRRLDGVRDRTAA